MAWRHNRSGTCGACGLRYERGTRVARLTGSPLLRHEACPDAPSATVPAPSNSDAAATITILADALAPILAGKVASGIDEDTVRAIVADALDGADLDAKVEAAVASRIVQTTIPIEIRRDGVPVATVKGQHFLFSRVFRLLDTSLSIYLWGPAGSGKSTLAMQVARAWAEAHGDDPETACLLDTLDPSTSRTAILGYRALKLDGSAPAVHTQFSRAWHRSRKQVAVYVADECDNAPAYVQTLFNTALANGHAPLAWGNVARGERFGFVATGNTPGRPTAQFPDRKPMSAAFKDRLYFVHVPLDENIERRAVGLPEQARKVRQEPTTDAKAWVEWVTKVRAWIDANQATLAGDRSYTPVVVSPRASLDGIRALAAGETYREVADGLVFRGADSVLTNKILDAVPLP